MTEQIEISVVTPYYLLWRGFSTFLESFSYNVQPYSKNGTELRANMVANRSPDVVLLDIDSEKTEAIDTCKWLIKHYPDVKILGLTLEAEKAIVKPLLECGASGFLFKASDPREIIAGIKKVLTKGAYFPPLQPWRYYRRRVQCLDAPDSIFLKQALEHWLNNIT